MAKNLNMTKGHPGKLFLVFTLPLAAGNLFQQMYTVMDTAIVGRGVGVEALAALGTVDWLNWMFTGIAQGFSQGFSVRMAQAFGRGDLEALKNTVGVSARLTGRIALAAAVLSQTILGLLFNLLQVPGSLRPMAERYMRIILAGVPALLLYHFCAAVLRSVGNSSWPLVATVAAALTNILLDLLAVFVLGWGMEGAAAATVLSQYLAGGLCLVKIWKTPILRIRTEHLKKDPVMVKDLMGLAWPIAAQNMVISVGGMMVQSVVNRFSTAFIAGVTATNKLYGLLETAAISYGYGVMTYTGQNYGAALWGRIRRGVRWALLISISTASVIAAGMLLFGREITLLFLSSQSQALRQEAGNTAYQYLCAMSVSLPLLYLLHVYRSALQGLGNTRIPLLSGIVEFCLRVGMAVLIGFSGYQGGIFMAEPLAWLGAMILLAAAYYYYASKRNRN